MHEASSLNIQMTEGTSGVEFSDIKSTWSLLRDNYMASSYQANPLTM